MKKKKQQEGKIVQALRKSPINYCSDLFVYVMVLGWIAILIVMTIVAIWATLQLGDTSIWAYVETLVSAPLTAGGAIWMIKNSVQHAIANSQGKQAHMDFPKINADGEDDGLEQSMMFEDASEEDENESAAEIDEESAAG